MTSYVVNTRQRQIWLLCARLLLAILSVVMAAGTLASAKNERSAASVKSRAAGEPILAIVSLRSQQITVYDANGWILRAPVSSGQPGRETPAGIFSVLEKEAEHYSNLYDDASMPHMQRLTWSGIALHGGVLPGHPASHGCIRMPYDFAERLFEVTKPGMRVIVAPGDVMPVAIAHPALFSPKPNANAEAAARAVQADEAAVKADQARLAAAAAYRDVAQATVPVRTMRNQKVRAETQLAAAERAVAAAPSAETKEQAEDAKAKAAAKVAELETQVAAAEAELQPKRDALVAAREAANAAETARAAAAEAARDAARALEPVSVFISRKTQRLYVRQAFRPILDIPITIQESGRADWHACFHGLGVHWQRRHAMERRLVGRRARRWRRRGIAWRVARIALWTSRADLDRSCGRQSGLGPDRHSPGHTRSDLRHGVAAIVSDHLR